MTDGPLPPGPPYSTMPAPDRFAQIRRSRPTIRPFPNSRSSPMLRFAALAAFLAAACVLTAGTAAADDTTLNVKEGDKFPNVPLSGAQLDKAKGGAKTLSIADLKGKTVVIFFYPAALTRGCTIESCGFRDLMKTE